MSKKPTIYIEAMVFAPPYMSGVGHATLEITKELLKIEKESQKFDLYLLVPFNKVSQVLKKFEGGPTPRIKKLWILPRVMELLMRLNLLPPVDLFTGRGIYLFPNYRNWRVSRSKSVTYVHDVSFKLYPEFVSPKNRDYLNKYIKRWMKRTDIIITLSQQVKKEIISNYDIASEKISVAYDGVSTQAYYPRSPAEINETKQRYGLAVKDYVLFVGNKEPRKNLQRLVEAFEELEDHLKERFALVLIGGGSWLSEGIDQAIEHALQNKVQVVTPDHFVEDKDLPALYSGAQLFAFVPVYEGFGIPPLEALASGTPVLASDIAVLREVLGDKVDYCDPQNVKSIAAGLTRNLSGNKESISEKDFLALYSWKRSAQQLLDAIL